MPISAEDKLKIIDWITQGDQAKAIMEDGDIDWESMTGREIEDFLAECRSRLAGPSPHEVDDAIEHCKVRPDSPAHQGAITALKWGTGRDYITGWGETYIEYLLGIR